MDRCELLVNKMFELHETEASLWEDNTINGCPPFKYGLETYTKIAKLATEIRNGIIELSEE